VSPPTRNITEGGEPLDFYMMLTRTQLATDVVLRPVSPKLSEAQFPFESRNLTEDNAFDPFIVSLYPQHDFVDDGDQEYVLLCCAGLSLCVFWFILWQPLCSLYDLTSAL